MTNTTMHPLSKPATRLTQGAIIKYCYSANYEPSSTFGLVVTARCDISNPSKAIPVVLYVPVVPMNEWLDNEIRPKFRETTYQAKYKETEKELAKESISLNAALQLPEELFVSKVLNQKSQKAKTAFATLLKIKSEYEKGLIAQEIAKPYKNDLKSFVERVIDNREIPYHYLPWIDEYKECGTHFVCLLREIHSIPFRIASQMIGGVSPQEYFPAYSKFDKNELSFCISEISSPEIELIIQRFSNIFCRIGVHDRHKKHETLSDLGVE